MNHPEFDADCGYLLINLLSVHQRLKLPDNEAICDGGEIGWMELFIKQCILVNEAINTHVDFTDWTGVFAYDVMDRDDDDSLPEAVYLAIMQGADPVPAALEWLSDSPDFPWSMPDEPDC